MAENQYDVIVIGAGHNGLVTAGYLARDGLSVLVLERMDKVGGAATTDEFSPGFMAPRCAYDLVLLQGKVIDDLRLREHGFAMAYSYAMDDTSSTIHLFPDGAYLGGPGVSNDFEAAEQIGRFSERDARAYPSWASFWDDASAIVYPYFLSEPPTMAELMESVRGTRREEVLEKLLTWSYIDLVEDHFEEPHVKAHFMRGGIQADPSSAGSMLGIAMYACARYTRDTDRGVPRMSMGTVTESMARAAKSFGAEIRTNSPVKDTLVDNGVAKGVRLESGEEIRSFVVVSNADPKRTFTTLFQPDEVAEETVRRVKRWKTDAGSAKLLAAMTELPDLSRYLGDGYDPRTIGAIIIAPSVEYYQQSWDDVMTVQMASNADPDLARGGGHVMSNWVVWEPPQPKDGTWDDLREEVGEQIIDVLTEYAPNLRDSLADWTLETPADMEARVGLTDGNICHLDQIPSQLLSQRQPYRTEVENFYMCGSGTHPSGAVTGAPGHNAAQAILKDLQRVAV